MSGRSSDLLRFYRKHRIDDQLTFYASRVDLFDRAVGQGLALSAVLLGFASAAGALAGTTLGEAKWWSAVAVIASAISTALAAYTALYAFEQQSKIYGDAARAARAASRPLPAETSTAENSVAEFVRRVESVFRQEHAQWGQLTSQIQITDQTKE